MNFPKLKKRLHEFFLKEEGRMLKNSAIALGSFLSGFAFFSVSFVKDAFAGCSRCNGHAACTKNSNAWHGMCLSDIKGPADNSYDQSLVYAVYGEVCWPKFWKGLSMPTLVSCTTPAWCGGESPVPIYSVRPCFGGNGQDDDGVPWHYNSAHYEGGTEDGIILIATRHMHHASHNNDSDI